MSATNPKSALYVIFFAFLGLVVGAILMSPWWIMEIDLDDRCETACAPLVGDDREGACFCAGTTGWVPLREARP